LDTVIASLPVDLRSKLMAAPPSGITVRLQAEMVINQLAFGAVKISFGELRRLVPGIFVNSGGEQDGKLINLPLQEILPRLNPALLTRRPVKKVEVAPEIAGPFADRGRGFTFTTQPLKGPSAPTPVSPSAPKPGAGLVPPMGVRNVSPGPIAPPLPPRSITPAAPQLDGSHVQPPVSPLSPRPLTQGVSGANGQGNGNGNGHGPAQPPAPRAGSANGNGNGHSLGQLPLRMSPAPAPAAAGQPASAVTILVALADLCASWPDSLQDEIRLSPLAQAKVALTAAMILPGLKRGRITMPWKQLRQLAKPDSAASSNDNLELELPLRVIAPLFVAAQKDAGRSHAKMAVSSEIPDLFFGFPQPAAAPATPVVPAAPAAPEAPIIPVLPAAPPAPPVAAAPPAPAVSLVPPLPKAPEAKPQDTNSHAWSDKSEALPAEAAPVRGEVPQTDFLNRMAHPKDVVARAAALPGVAGAVVAMQDGLRVASQVPAELNAETLAAFLPQIFERLNQSTRELRMGVLNNLNFTVGNVPWKIFRVNAVYFAAFGRAGETFPSAQLAQLAAELDRKKTS
jgi:predicted regulator of Ras-like GTPase activity (Roadblock/LC7/MglB family)